MSIILKRLVVKHGSVPRYIPPVDWEGMWRIYTVCSTRDKRSCSTLKDINDLDSPHDESVRRTLIKFSLIAHTGLNIKEQLSKKNQCHPGHKFKYKGKTTTIWRLWLYGVVRVYFCNLDNKEIAILQSLVKTKNDLDDGEKEHLENLAKTLFDCYYANKHDYI